MGQVEDPADVIEQAARARSDAWAAELLDNLTGGRMSGTNYPVRVMVQEVEAYFERTVDDEVADLRAELAHTHSRLDLAVTERSRAKDEARDLRATMERVRELADEWRSNHELPPIHRPPLMQWDQAESTLRAALDPEGGAS